MNWFLYDKGLRHERVKCYKQPKIEQPLKCILYIVLGNLLVFMKTILFTSNCWHKQNFEKCLPFNFNLLSETVTDFI